MPSRIGLRYSAAIFLGSGLLFLIEFVSAKRLLPLLGGGAAVWTACLVFFQCALLGGYWLTHWLVTRVDVRRQASIYVALLALSLIQLGYAINPYLRATPSRPISSVIWLLASVIGLPFLTLSATSPLLQSWYARETNGGSAYRLYSISNVGSLLALVLYPLVLEPFLSLHQQSLLVAVAFGIFAVASFFIVSTHWRASPSPIAASVDVAPPRASLRASRIALWIALSTCGSLLLAAVTTYISQNIATLPLLWIGPLTAYLMSFIVAFSGERWLPREVTVAVGAVGLGGSYYLLSKGILGTPLLIVVSGFCLSLFLICLFLHAELYRRRPPEKQLTSFYSCLAIGGALGAVLVGVVAPSLLDGNYELAFGLTLAAALGVIAAWDFGILPRILAIGGTVGMASLIATQLENDHVDTIRRVRNFYGTLSVIQIKNASFDATSRTLYNGTISHGREVFREDLAHAPTSYYGHPSGVGLAIDLCCDARPRRIGVIGLGTGTIAAYGRAGDHIRFYDINPAVEDIARKQFAYLRGSPADIDVVLGDARVSMAGEAPQRYDVIVVDAFSGDAIPVHLITLEALEVYRRHLAPGGIVAFHVSNRHLDLKPVVAQIAARAGMGIAHIANAADTRRDVWTSDWVLVTKNSAFLERKEIAKASEAITIPRRLRLWTDDYNSLLPIFKVRR
ncbi:MAG: integral rane protein-like protein [Gemmatimonadetes bacterium]|nr:integral rane protein-like protein [Gemmatimonadota bacterium]